MIYTKCILLEHSDVPVPANISALNIAVGKGLEIKSRELIDDLELEIIDEEKKSESILFQGFEKLSDGETIKEEKKVVTKPEETDQYIRIPVKGEEGKHSGHKIRTITISAGEGIKALFCVDCKKVITYLFDKTKWDMKKAKKWMADHGKNVSGYYEGTEEDTLMEMENENLIPTVKDIEDEIKDIAEAGVAFQDKPKPEEKEEDEIIKIELKKRSPEDMAIHFGEIYSKLYMENKELKEKLKDIEVKAGAVLNKKNKDNLKKIKELADEVLESAESAEPVEEGKEADELEIEDDKKLEVEEKDGQEQKDDVEEKEETFDISADEIKKIVNEAQEEQANKVGEKLNKIVTDNFKRLTGKVI